MTPNYSPLVALFIDFNMRLKDKERIISNLGRGDYTYSMWRKAGKVWAVCAQEGTRVLVKPVGTKNTKWISTEVLRRDYEEVK